MTLVCSLVYIFEGSDISVCGYMGICLYFLYYALQIFTSSELLKVYSFKFNVSQLFVAIIGK